MLIYVLGCLDAAMLLIGPDFSRIMPTCVAVIAATPQFRYYKLASDLGINIGIVLIYAVIFVKIYFVRSQSMTEQDSTDHFKQVIDNEYFKWQF